MISIRVLKIRKHPAWEKKLDKWHEDDWAVQHEVTIDKRKKTFWRWMDGQRGSGIPPTEEAAIEKQWLDMWHNAGGFDLSRHDYEP